VQTISQPNATTTYLNKLHHCNHSLCSTKYYVSRTIHTQEFTFVVVDVQFSLFNIHVQNHTSQTILISLFCKILHIAICSQNAKCRQHTHQLTHIHVKQKGEKMQPNWDTTTTVFKIIVYPATLIYINNNSYVVQVETDVGHTCIM